MRTIIVFLALAGSAFGQYTLSQVVALAGCNDLDSRGYNYAMPFDTNRGLSLWYSGKISGPDISIYSGHIWGYNSASHQCFDLINNGASGATPDVCPPNPPPSGGFGGSDIVRDPLEGHPNGFPSFDTRRKKLLITESLCSGAHALQTDFWDSAGNSMDTPVNATEFGAGSGTYYGTGRSYQGTVVFVPGTTAAGDRYLFYWSMAPLSPTRKVVYYSPGPEGDAAYHDVTTTIKGFDGATCESGTSTHCPPDYWYGMKGWTGSDGYVYVYGGCGTDANCTGRFTDLYQIDAKSTPMVIRKLTKTGSALSGDGSPFPWGAMDTSRNRLIINDAVDSWKSIDLSTASSGTVAVSTLTITNDTASGHSPNFFSTLWCETSPLYRCHAAATYDSVNDKFIGFVNNAQGTSPTIYEIAFGSPPVVTQPKMLGNASLFGKSNIK